MPLRERAEGISRTYPTFCIRFLMIMGYTVPEMLEPKAITPYARPSLCLNQCAGRPTKTPKIVPHEICWRPSIARAASDAKHSER